MRLLSVNVGAARPLRIGGRNILTAIGKAPVAGPVAVGRLGLHGDEQADPSVHGGLDKALYAYPVEHLSYWQAQRREAGVSLFNESLPPGFMGENLSIEGLLETEVWIGDELHFPGCVLRVTAPREPCFKLNAVMGLNTAGRLMMERLCPGFYLAVAQPGRIDAGQPFTLVPGTRGLRVSEAFAAKRLKHQR
ncbi:MAG: MOSC domain-containing protein [Comamonadaceae bacterium]|nr:MOSC domain-containing protein [Comamonadaceae bacterium]